jgi:hypothetical protein
LVNADTDDRPMISGLRATWTAAIRSGWDQPAKSKHENMPEEKKVTAKTS